jgi:CRISPR/Cas system-associated protein Cas10 (large subunit of type III CRISPR-Cas system)
MNENLLFVGGDLSGIQDYIYSISSKRAMVSLKGRSAYLSQFTKVICKKILDKTCSNKESIIYNSGGKFYLTILDTENNIKAIKQIQNDVESELWNKHFGKIALNIGFVPFVYTNDKLEQVVVEGETDGIRLLWNKLNEKFVQMKTQKFKSLLADRFEVERINANEQVCEITGIEGAIKDSFKFKDKEESLYVLPSVKEQIELGLKLRYKNKFKTFEEYASDTYLGILRMDVDGLGKKFASGFKSMDEYKAYSNNLDKFFTDKLCNDFQKRNEFEPYLNIVYAGGDDVFVVGRWDKVIDFAETIREEFRVYCDKVLKSDLSISGGIAIVHPKFPIAKAAQIAADAESKAKDYEYNNRQKNAFCLFGQAVSWCNELPDFLKQDKLDLESIDELLEFITPSIGSSIQEYAFVKTNKMLLEYFISSELLSKAILHQLMLWYSIIEDNDKKKKGEKRGNADYSYIWHNAYYLTRYNDRFAGVRAKEKKEGYNALFDIEKKKLKVSDYCNLLKNKMFTSNDWETYFRLLSIAARWAELSLKITKKQ